MERRDGATEIEITPEVIEALEATFLDWKVENAHAIQMGATGDVAALFFALSEAATKRRKSVLDAPRAALNS